jgi:hypothetical protein
MVKLPPYPRAILLILALHAPLSFPDLGPPSGSGQARATIVSAALAQDTAVDLPHYTILRTAGPIDIDGNLDEPSWQAVVPVDNFLFPWWNEGEQEPTEARMLWDDKNLYVSFIAHDKHISATLTRRDDPVSRDDAVEVFVAPEADDVSQYFNFEFNALGTILDRSPHDNRSSSWNAVGIAVAITIDGTLNDEADEDRLWVTEIAIPFANFEAFAPRLPPSDGDTWRLNLYRIGGQVNPQFSVWSNTQTEKPQYHVPERFGIVDYSSVEANATAVQGKPWGIIKESRAIKGF